MSIGQASKMGVAAALAALLGSLPGQTHGLKLPTGSPFVVQDWHVGSGLPQNSIGDVLQARDGFVWVGTFGGLCRFDGSAWRIFDTSVAPGLGGNRVLCLHEDRDGMLWVGTERGGISRGRGGEFVTLPGWTSTWVGAIERLHDGRLLVAAAADVFEVTAEGAFRPLYPTPLPGIRYLFEAGNEVLACGAGGLYGLQPERAVRYAQHNLDSASVAAGGAVYLGGRHGLEVWRNHALVAVPGGPSKPVQAVHAAADGSLWYATTGSLGRLQPKAPEQSFTVPIDASVRVIAEDQSGGIWLGFIGGGLVRLQHAEVRVLGVARGIPAAGQNSVVADGTGGLYVGTYCGLMHGRDGTFAPVAAVGKSPVLAMLQEPDGSLWLGLDSGLHRLRDGVLEACGGESSGELGMIRALQRVDGEIWAGTAAGLRVLRDGRLVELPLPRSLTADAHLIAPGSAGSLWFATPTACVQLAADRTVCDVWHSGKDLPAGEVRAVLPRENGGVWLGIYGGGFVALDPTEHAPRFAVDRRHGLFDHAVCSVLPLGDRWVVGSNRGCYVVVARDLEALVAGSSVSIACRPLAGPIDATAEANGGIQPSACVVDGMAYLCGLGPLLEVDREHLARQVVAPECYVDKLLIGERALAPVGLVEAEAGARTFVFRLGACEFDRPEQVRFRWRLLPRDENWSPWSYSREAQFALTAPGLYQFEAMALAAGDQPSAEPVRVQLRVPQLWSEFGAVRLGIVLLLLGAGWLAFRFGVVRAAVREQLLQQLVGERTVELRHAQEHLEERVRDRTSELQRALVQIESDHEQRRRLERELELLRRMESLGQLAGGVAHDFNNLLTIVLGNAALLEADLGDRPEDAELATRIREAGERGRRMTRHLLAVASKQAVAPGSLDLGQQVVAMTGMLQQLLGSQIAIDLRPAAEPAWVRVGASQFEQILMNLAVNARDAMPVGGRFTIELRVAAGRVHMLVSDTGIGMTAEVRERAFEPFFTTKQAPRGTGLGLATVYGITKQLQGEIEIDSQPGVGTTFRFVWPLAAATVVEPIVVMPSPAVAMPLAVLLVDDEAEVRTVVRRLLERAGCLVVEASSGEEALRQLVGGGPRIDVVLSDVQMPGLMGVALVQEVRRLRPSMPIVFLSGHAEVGAVVGGLTALGLEVLSKPPVGELLVQALHRARAAAGRPALPVLSVQ